MNPTEPQISTPVPEPVLAGAPQPEPQKTVAAVSENPIRFNVDYPEHQSRIMALFSLPFYFIRAILLIPHIIILYILALVLLLVSWLNFWAILFTGHSSKSLHDFMVGTMRWQNRMSAYMYGLTDKYPPFGFGE